jgi:hypothetical protein
MHAVVAVFALVIVRYKLLAAKLNLNTKLIKHYALNVVRAWVRVPLRQLLKVKEELKNDNGKFNYQW